MGYHLDAHVKNPNNISNIVNNCPLLLTATNRYCLTGPYDPGFHPGQPTTTTMPADVRRGRSVEETVAIQALPFPNAVTDWRSLAICQDTDPELFFPVGSTGLALDQIAAAKAVCMQCPARPDCLDYALDSNQDSGVWGGLSEDERRQIRRQRATVRRNALVSQA
jgi:WhiB family redox-sensing transcriptional regulator